MRRCLLAAVVLAGLMAPALAQEDTIAAPQAHVSNYDPTLSAKEAVLANWDLAAAGIRAGAVMGGRVAVLADRGTPFARLTRQADKAQKTLTQRWNASQWVYEGEPDLARLDTDVLRAVAAASLAECPSSPCKDETVALKRAFAEATAQLEVVAAETRAAVKRRMAEGDAALMAEQLSLVADYLDSGAWGRDFALTEFGRDTEEVAARIVGALSLWRNVEPYVGLANPEIDAAVNAEAEQLLRTLRLETRRTGALDPEGAEMAVLRARAEALAAEFRRAAALFGA